MLPSQRQVPCTLNSSVTRLEPAANEKPAPSCPQHGGPMLPSPSAMHTQHERDPRRVRQLPTRS
eukprot:4329244-Prymnesium_polylepis.1